GQRQIRIERRRLQKDRRQNGSPPVDYRYSRSRRKAAELRTDIQWRWFRRRRNPLERRHLLLRNACYRLITYLSLFRRHPRCRCGSGATRGATVATVAPRLTTEI